MVGNALILYRYYSCRACYGFSRVHSTWTVFRAIYMYCQQVGKLSEHAGEEDIRELRPLG
jgi:hypothetical protein